MVVLQRVVGAGASLLLSRLTGKASTVKGGTVETGELHSVLEPLRRASRCRFLYSNKETFFFCGGFCAEPPPSPLPSTFTEREKATNPVSSELG